MFHSFRWALLILANGSGLALCCLALYCLALYCLECVESGHLPVEARLVGTAGWSRADAGWGAVPQVQLTTAALTGRSPTGISVKSGADFQRRTRLDCAAPSE